MRALKTKAKPRPRGRRPENFRGDADRYAVAYLLMRTRTRFNGKLPSLRQAAALAILGKENCIHHARIVESPAPELAPSGHRNSPLKKCLREGYLEREFLHVEKKAAGAAFEAGIKRLLRKYHQWIRPNTPRRHWLEFMCIAWQAAAYPHATRAKTGFDPALVCLCAARRAGETAFCARVMLPLLRSQDVNVPKMAFASAA
jgi:hypothetical protein